MALASRQPFIDSRAFNKTNSTYVLFPSQADAMIASLQLFHDVPCRIMDLIFSVITHPDFDARQVKLRNSIDVIDVVEESRLKDRLTVVHERSIGKDGRHGSEQAGFPEFVLGEVLDIIHSERMDRIWSSFESVNDKESVYESRYIYEDQIIKQMSLVHRSWTTPSQKALGRILFINKPASEGRFFLSPTSVRKSIFGPWTTVVAFHMYCELDDEDDEFDFSDDFHEEYRQWFENLHRILVGFTNLRSMWIQSYASLFTKWANLTIKELLRRNTYLKDVTLHAETGIKPFILDCLAKDLINSKIPKTLDIDGARFSKATMRKLLHGTDFMYLSSLTIECSTSSLKNDLEALRIICTLSEPFLESLHIICTQSTGQCFEELAARILRPAECTNVFGHLRTLRIDGSDTVTAAQLLKWIARHSRNLKDVTLNADILSSTDILSLIPATIWSLDLQGMETRWPLVEEIIGWTKCILGIFTSGHFSDLKSFSFYVPGRRFEHLKPTYDKSCEQEVENSHSQIQEFEELMKCLCESAGIKYSLDLY